MVRFWNKKYFTASIQEMPWSDVPIGEDLDRTGKGRAVVEITPSGSVSPSVAYFLTVGGVTRRLVQEGAVWKFRTVPLASGSNVPTFEQGASDLFTGDGSTTEFTLSTAAGDTTYPVYISGRQQTSGFTRTTTKVTFSVAPRNGTAVEARYNLADCTALTLSAYVPEPAGENIPLNGVEGVTLREAVEGVRYTSIYGVPMRFDSTRSYEALLSFQLEENARKFLDSWAGKTFRLFFQNERAWDYRQDILATCSIDSGADVSYIDGKCTVPIAGTDFYQGQPWSLL